MGAVRLQPALPPHREGPHGRPRQPLHIRPAVRRRGRRPRDIRAYAAAHSEHDLRVSRVRGAGRG